MAFFRASIGGGGGGGSQTAIGTSQYDGNNEVTVNLGFKPKYLAIMSGNTSNRMMNIYNEDISTTQFMRAYGTAYGAWVAIGTTPYCIRSISNTGFSVSGYVNVNVPFSYFAIG